MRRTTSLALIALLWVAICRSWTGVNVSGLYDSKSVRDFIVPDNGIFAGYPLILTEFEGVSELIWVPDPAAPVSIGSFEDPVLDFSSRRFNMILDPDGNPVVVGLSEGRCNLHRYQPGGWLPARSVPITGYVPCMQFVSGNELVIDYYNNMSTRRCRINMDTWNITEELVAEGEYTFMTMDWYNRMILRLCIPVSPFIHVVRLSDSADFHSSEYRCISNVPESAYRYSVDNEWHNTVADADRVSEENWVVGWRFHELPLRVKCSGSAMTDLGPADSFSVDTFPNGSQAILWSDSEAKQTKLSRFRDQEWSVPEIVLLDAAP